MVCKCQNDMYVYLAEVSCWLSIMLNLSRTWDLLQTTPATTTPGGGAVKLEPQPVDQGLVAACLYDPTPVLGRATLVDHLDPFQPRATSSRKSWLLPPTTALDWQLSRTW